MAAIPLAHITGLVLAGGQGSRMGGVDKGLQHHQGLPLALHALQRLRPQVGQVLVNANRNLDTYRALGAPVWPDAQAAGGERYPGPLTGFLAGLAHCESRYMVTVPCDTPHYPMDLVARLAQALVAENAEVAVAATHEGGRVQVQPVFCLMATTLVHSLVAYTQAGQRRIDRWTGQHRCAVVPFDDPAAFDNINTIDDLQRLQQGGAGA